MILDKTAEESCEYQRKLWAEEEAAVREALLQKNAVITQLTDSEYEAFRQVCAVSYTHLNAGEGLIFYGSTIVPFKDDFPKDTQLYRIMTTKPEETVQN